MNNTGKTSKSQASVHGVMYWVVGILFIFTMLTTWLVSGLFAKYTNEESQSDSARVAGAGNVELCEHKADLKNGIYVLDENEEVTKNKYEKVIPGVDIAKDPFVKLDFKNAEVRYALYVKVTENKIPTYKPNVDSDPVKTVKYGVTEDWDLQNKLSNTDKGVYVYKYNKSIDQNFVGNIKILKDDKLYVSEHYFGNGQGFSLVFEAWIEQID